MPKPLKYPDFGFQKEYNRKTGDWTVQATTQMPCGIALKGTGVSKFLDRSQNVAAERLKVSARNHMAHCKPHRDRPDLGCGHLR